MPDHWQETTLGSVATVVSERVDPTTLSDAVYVGLEHLETDSRTLLTWGFSSDVSSSTTPFIKGDTLFGRLRPYLRKGCVAPFAGVCTPEILVVRSGATVDSRFLGLLVLNDAVFGECNRLSAGSRMPRTSATDLKGLSVLVPPLEEQRRIVDLVGSIDTYIDSLETQIDTTRTARIALTTALLDSLDGTPTKSLAEIEDEGLVELGRGKVISKKTMSSKPGDFPVYSSAAQNDGMIGSYNEYMFDEELITWSVDGGGHLFHRRRHKFSVTNIGGYLRILDPTKLRYGYLCAVLQGLHSRCHFDWQHKAHPSVIRYEYSKIPIPEMAQQQEIEQTIEAIDEQISSLESQVESVRALRSGVLSELLSGERLLDESYDVAVGL